MKNTKDTNTEINTMITWLWKNLPVTKGEACTHAPLWLLPGCSILIYHYPSYKNIVLLNVMFDQLLWTIKCGRCCVVGVPYRRCMQWVSFQCQVWLNCGTSTRILAANWPTFRHLRNVNHVLFTLSSAFHNSAVLWKSSFHCSKTRRVWT